MNFIELIKKELSDYEQTENVSVFKNDILQNSLKQKTGEVIYTRNENYIQFFEVENSKSVEIKFCIPTKNIKMLKYFLPIIKKFLLMK